MANPALTGSGDVRVLFIDAHAAVRGGRAVGTLPAWMADGLAHPGVIALPLRDGPLVNTRLVWHSHTNPIVGSLLDLATAWTRDGRP